MSLDLIWDGHGEQILLLFTVGPLSWCVFEFYLGWIWEGLAKQILTLFTVGPLFGCAFGPYLALALEVDKILSRKLDLIIFLHWHQKSTK